MVVTAGGCAAVEGLVIMVKGTDDDADFSGLKDKKVAVVCRPLVSLQYRNAGAARDLAQQLGTLLQAKVAKITVIDQQKVANWMDENTWDEFSEIGQAMKADIVIGIDLTSFGVLEGQTLYRGRASATIKVYDVAKKKTVWDKSMNQVVYPPNTAIPATDKPESEFRREFVLVVAEQIGRYFYAHDPNADVGLDSKAGLP
jgi:hypothetical protein